MERPPTQETLAANARRAGHITTRLRTCRGIAMVEAIVAITLFALCVGGTAYVVMNARQLSDMARDRYVAANLAKSRLERARSFDFDQLHLFAEKAVVLDESGNPNRDGNFRRTTTISNVAERLTELAIRVEVRNRITRKFGNRPETLHSYIADYIQPPEED